MEAERLLYKSLGQAAEGPDPVLDRQRSHQLSPGDAGSGPSEIRRYLIENDLLEAVVQLPNDLFYNTGIATYIWVVTRSKEARRIGKVQLIDASKCFAKRFTLRLQ